MPKNMYYEDVKVLKKPFKSKLKNFLIFLFFVGILAVSVISANMLSKALTVGNVSNLFIYGGTSLKLDKSKLYAVAMGSYETLGEAEQVALGATIQGASGYIWNDDKYYVIGSIYYNKEDAETVLNQLSETNYSTSILEIDFPQVNINFKELENKQVSVIREGMTLIDKCIYGYYDYSIKFDKGEINHLAVSSEISSLRGDVKVIISNIQNILNSYGNDVIQEIQNSMIRLDEELNQSMLKTIDNTATNSNLKKTMSTIVRIKFELVNKLA